MTFLEAVNRMLRLSTLMQWDDDDITSFSSTQHAANISLCRQAVQHVLNDLVADEFFWDEDATGNITTVASTRTYSLSSDFVHLQDEKPWFFRLTGAAGTDANGQFLYQYPDGENQLMKDVPAYTSDTGEPQWFYFTDDQQIGMYPIPDSAVVYRYHYEKNVMVDNENDSLPFDSDQKGYAFVDMATRVFTFLFTRQPLEGIENDVIYKRAKSALLTLNRKIDPIKRYGYFYG